MPTFVDETDLDDPTETAEIVEQQPSTAVERVHTAEHDAAIVAAEAAALAMPGVPGRDEFMALAMTARILSLSGAAPKAVRDNPHLAFHVAMVGRDLGISPSASLELIDIIPGKWDAAANAYEYRLSLSPQLLNGQLRRLGLGSIRPLVRDAQHCIAVALEPGGRVDPRCNVEHVEHCECRGWMGISEFTWEQARRAELVGPNCKPGEHKKDQKRKSGQREWMVCGCNQGYVTYPERMLWWRASGFAADDYFPEAGLGLYSPEALGAVVDDEGRPIDPATVELPAGYSTDDEPASSDTSKPDEPERGDPVRLWELQRKIHALPAEQRAQLAERWKEAKTLTHEIDGARRPIRAHQLPMASCARAHSMVDSFTANAAKADPTFEPEQALRAVDAQIANRLIPQLMSWLYPLTYDETAPVSPSASPSPSAPHDSGEAPQSAESDPGAPLPPDERALYVEHVRQQLLIVGDPEVDVDDLSDDDAIVQWERMLDAVQLDVVPVEPVDEIIERVKAMSTADVKVQLLARAISVPRATAAAREALATRLVREHVVEEGGQ